MRVFVSRKATKTLVNYTGPAVGLAFVLPVVDHQKKVLEVMRSVGNAHRREAIERVRQICLPAPRNGLKHALEGFGMTGHDALVYPERCLLRDYYYVTVCVPHMRVCSGSVGLRCLPRHLA